MWGKLPKKETKNKKIMTAKTKKKKYYDALGNEINQKDRDIMENVMRGDKIIYHNEEKSGEKKD